MANQNALKQTLIGLLGEAAGTKLYLLLNACCDTLSVGTLTVGTIIGDSTLSDGSTGVTFDTNIEVPAILTDTISESTAGAGVTVDGVKMEDGGVSNPAGTIFAGFFPLGAPQALAGPGAANITAYQTQFTSTGTGDAITLADATQIGQMKRIDYVAEAAGADTGVITLSGYTSITLNAIGDYVVVIFDGTDYFITESVGVTVVA